jgi:hypothetical protein
VDSACKWDHERNGEWEWDVKVIDLQFTYELCLRTVEINAVCSNTVSRTRGNFRSLTMAALTPRPLPQVLLFSLIPIGAWFIVRPLLDPVPALPALYTCFGFSIFALLATLYLVPALGPTFVKANFHGRDLLKVYKTPMFVDRVVLFVWRVSQ